MSEVLTEIVKADPNFDKDSFLKQCEKDIIPNILEVNRLFLAFLCFLSLSDLDSACFIPIFCSMNEGYFTKERLGKDLVIKADET